MVYHPLEKLFPRANSSIYKLVLMAAKRATELADGSPRLVDFSTSEKVTNIALDEIAMGKVELKSVADARQSEGGKQKKQKKD